MSDFVRVLCRSPGVIMRSQITEFITEGVYFDAPRFEAIPSIIEHDWRTLTIFYQPEKRPIVLHKSVGDTLMHAEIAEMSREMSEGLRRRLQETVQTIAIEINSSSLTEEAWQMLDSLEASLARSYDGVIFVDGEGFYDAALQKIEP